MTAIIGLGIKYWREILLALLVTVACFLGWLLQESYKEQGKLAEKLEVQEGAVKILAGRLHEANQVILDDSHEATEGFEVCQEAAAKSDSASFRKGVEVGKILGRSEACSVQSPDAPWPSGAGSVSQPASPTTSAQ